MMLLEPGTRIEADTEAVMAVVQLEYMRQRIAEGWTQNDAYDQAERDTARMLDAFTRAGLVVRHVEHTAWVRGRIEAKQINAALAETRPH